MIQISRGVPISHEISELARIKVDKRDGAGRILALNSSLLPQLLTRCFDEDGHLKTMSFEASRTQSYSYVDKSSKLSSWNTLGHLESFGYDKDTGRLNESNEAAYTFGANSALPLRSPLAPSASQYAPSGLDATQTQNAPSAQASEPHALDYTFNAKGQRTGTKNAALSWQGERLSSYETSNTRADYTYDASGMRLKANITASDGASQTLRYAYDGLRLLELNSTGTTETSNFSIGYLYEADIAFLFFGVTSLYVQSTWAQYDLFVVATLLALSLFYFIPKIPLALIGANFCTVSYLIILWETQLEGMNILFAYCQCWFRNNGCLDTF